MPIALPDLGTGELDPTGAGRTARGKVATADQDPMAFIKSLTGPEISYLAGPDGKGQNPALTGALAAAMQAGAASIGGGGPPKDPRMAAAAAALMQSGPVGAGIVGAYSILPPGAQRMVNQAIAAGQDIANQFAQGVINPFGSQGVGESTTGTLAFIFDVTNFIGLISGLFGSLLGALGFGPDWGDIEPTIRRGVQQMIDAAQIPLRVDLVNIPNIDPGDLLDAIGDNNQAFITRVLRTAQVDITPTIQAGTYLPIQDIDSILRGISGITGSSFTVGSAVDQMTGGLAAGATYRLDFGSSPPRAYRKP